MMDETVLAFIRVLIGDTTDPFTFSDEQIEAVYTGTGERAYLTAALLLESAAASEALTYKIVKTDDLSVDGVSGAKILLERATRLRAQDAALIADDLAEGFDVVYPHDTCTYCLEYAECCCGRYSWGF
jgi:hypothetical protein